MENRKFFANCQELNIPFWKCPQFLFIVMGAIIALSSITIYLVGVKYTQDFYLVALTAVLANLFLFIFSFLITENFEKAIQNLRIKSELTSIVIHNLRSPLTNIRWITEEMDLGEQKEVLNKNLKRMAELTENLLVVTKIESKSFTLNKTKFFLDELTQEVINGFSDLFQIHEIKVHFDAEKTEVFADYRQIRMVIEKLIDNAVKFTRGSGEIKISIFKNVFKIEDQGVGIPAKEQKHIFERFFRANNNLNKIKGSGISLNIVKKIIDKHRGKIWFKSKEGEGTTFYFSV